MFIKHFLQVPSISYSSWFLFDWIQGATKQVRFQPRVGKLLATAVVNGINIIDVETDTLLVHLKVY